VLLTTRSTVENMPAAQEEIDDANREGVEIQGQLQPVEVVTDGNDYYFCLSCDALSWCVFTMVEN
jgi:hypothetical protein